MLFLAVLIALAAAGGWQNISLRAGVHVRD